MLRRLFVGLVLGLLVGVLLAAGLVLGLKVILFEGAGGITLAYLAACVTGVLTGLVAGKPIWASGAKIEAGLKAVVGALLGAGAMFALRQWGGAFAPDLSMFNAGGPAAIGSLPAASIPLISAVLGTLFELDNTDAPAENRPVDRKRVAAPRRIGVKRATPEDAADESDSMGHERGSASKRSER